MGCDDEGGAVSGSMRGGHASSSAEDATLGRRLVRYANGGIFGELDFFLRNPRSYNVRVAP